MLRKIEKYLSDNNIQESRAEARLLVESISGLSIEQLITGEEIPLHKAGEIEQAAKNRVQSGAPIQHILGFAHFMGNKFLVNENVLIPRDETEILVECAVKIIKTTGAKDILDIGTGSGCIACSLALKCPEIQALGVDISTAALSVAIENAQKLQLINRAIFRKSDLFSNIREKFDMIVSNPPYIAPEEKENIQKEVSFDPESALYTNDSEGLEFYKKIISQAPKYLNPKGHILFEVGQGQSEKVEKLLLESGFKNIETQKDLAGIERIVFGQLL